MSNESHRSLHLIPGELVDHDGKYYRITEVLDFQSVIAVDPETGRAKHFSILELSAVKTDIRTTVKDIAVISDDEWKVAQFRLDAIRPLIDTPYSGRKDVEARALVLGIHFTTLYGWLRRYRNAESIDVLLPGKRGPKLGETRVSSQIEAILSAVIDEFYLKSQRLPPSTIINEVKNRCRNHKIDPPHPNTVRNRIASISERDKLRNRGYGELAKNKFLPVPGEFPNADYPLAVVQIDHTPVDLILVDDVYRKPIGRPWLTLAMDIHSRMVVGYYLSFDAPSITSVAMTVSQSILPKEDWMVLHNVDANWPVWGVMNTIFVDNGPEFRSEDFRKACIAHGIRVEYRPPGTPRYGGHIERLLGNFMRITHEIPGTTFSSIKDKDGYDPERHAAMTISAFERWLVILITKYYHMRPHSKLGMPPIKKWEIGIFGGYDTQGCGLPAIPGNRHKLMLDFLPNFPRTVQNYGIEIDHLFYYADVLRPWIAAVDPDSPNKKKKFVFRRDPRDISIIWFYDPELEQYFRIPFANQNLPTMSVWEFKQARARALKEGMRDVDENQLLDAISEMREVVESEAAKTKSARRALQRRAEHSKKVTPDEPLSQKNQPSVPLELTYIPSDIWDDDLDPIEVE